MSEVERESETPMDMVTRIIELTEKWLKGSKARHQVANVVAKEQFIEVLPEETEVQGERA